MSAPPEAHAEYSRGSGAFRGLLAPLTGRSTRGSAASPGERTAGTGAVVLVALIGALLVLVAQFVALYYVRIATSSNPVKTVGTGANHGWAPLPIALVCLALVLAVYRHGNRTALLGLALLGIATLVIALAVDLPDVHATGLIGSSVGQFERAANSPAAGLYLETLGSVLLLVSGGIGFLMLGGGVARIALPAGAWRGRFAIGRRVSTAATRSRAPEASSARPVTEASSVPRGTEASSAPPATDAPALPATGASSAPSATGASSAPPATEAPPEPPGADPGTPRETPPETKGPLSLGDNTRRRWSAS